MAVKDTEKTERLAAALRENLKRRKGRERAVEGAPHTGPSER